MSGLTGIYHRYSRLSWSRIFFLSGRGLSQAVKTPAHICMTRSKSLANLIGSWILWCRQSDMKPDENHAIIPFHPGMSGGRDRENFSAARLVDIAPWRRLNFVILSYPSPAIGASTIGPVVLFSVPESHNIVSTSFISFFLCLSIIFLRTSRTVMRRRRRRQSPP